MASVRGVKRRLSSTSLIDKDKALKEIEKGQNCIATSRKCGVAGPLEVPLIGSQL